MDVAFMTMGVLLVAALIVVVVLALRARGPSAPATPAPWSDDAEAGARVVLDLVVDDPDRPSVQRLVQEAASRTLDAAPRLEQVVVVDRDGRHLGEIRRLPPPRRDVAVPESLHEPHQRRRATPDPVRSESRARSGTPGPLPERDVEVEVDALGARPFADRYDLPPAVRERIDDPTDPAAVIAALLAAAGRPAERHGDLVISGDAAVVIALVKDGGERSLSRAFLRVRESGAAYGLVVRLGYADPVLIHHREAAAPQVRHVPASAVQRMADAVELGEDPIAFALGPPVAH